MQIMGSNKPQTTSLRGAQRRGNLTSTIKYQDVSKVQMLIEEVRLPRQ